MEGFIIFGLCFSILLLVINSILLVSSSVVLTKIYGFMIAQQQAIEAEIERKKKAAGLVDVETSQIPYHR